MSRVSKGKLSKRVSSSVNLIRLTLWLGSFSFSINWVATYDHGKFPSTAIWLYLLVALFLLPPYLHIKKYSAPKINWGYVTLLVFLTSVMTPAVLQTDLYRYIWDGLVSSLGVNPYLYSPAEFQPLKDLFWVKQINHSELHSVYPPAAQAIFWISTWMNPFFWEQYLQLSLPFQSSLGGFLVADQYWKVEFGWKLVVGIFSSALLYSFRHKRWDLILLHPAFLLLVLANAHIDILMVTCLVMSLKPAKVLGSFSGFNRRSLSPRSQSGSFSQASTILLAVSILSKWLPLVLLPGILWKETVRNGKAQALSMGLLLAGISGFWISIYFKGADGYMFSSTAAFAKHWMFFGYIHRFVADLLLVLEVQDPINWAKYICAAVGVIYGALVSLLLYKRYLSMRLYSLLIMLGVFSVAPTLHPWYLLLLIPLGLPFFPVLKTPILWPFLGVFSKLFYLENHDPTSVRWVVYSIISVSIVIDFRKIIHRVRKLAAGSARTLRSSRA